MMPLHHRLQSSLSKGLDPPDDAKTAESKKWKKKNLRPKLIPGDTNCGEVPRKTADVPEKTGETKSSKKVENPRGRKNRICQVGVFQFYLRERGDDCSVQCCAKKSCARRWWWWWCCCGFSPSVSPATPWRRSSCSSRTAAVSLQHLRGRRVSSTPGCYPVIHRVIRGSRSRLIGGGAGYYERCLSKSTRR